MQLLETTIRPTPIVETPITPAVSGSIPGHQQINKISGSDEWTFNQSAICWWSCKYFFISIYNL